MNKVPFYLMLKFMFTHIPTGNRFANRKEAKKIMGTSSYNRALKNREFTLHCTD